MASSGSKGGGKGGHPPLARKNRLKKMAAEHSGLYCMFISPPYPKFLDPLLVAIAITKSDDQNINKFILWQNCKQIPSRDAISSKTFFFFLKFFCRTHSHVLFSGHWYPCFGFLVTSPLGFKARVGSALFALRRRMYCTFPEIHLWCYTLPTSWWTALRGADRVHILPKDITVWQQWVSNPRSTDHECRALTIRPCGLSKTLLIASCDLFWW